MLRETENSPGIVKKVESLLTETTEPRPRTFSHDPITRTSSDPDLRAPGRTRSNASQCSRSRSQTRTRVSIDELMETATRKLSYGQGPRPSPLGMASSQQGSTTQLDSTVNAEESTDLSFSQSLDFGDASLRNEQHPVETSEQLIERQKRKEAAFMKLRMELERAHLELRKRDEECKKLSRVRDDLDNEVEELTASLFEEAHKMVTEAKTKQASAEMQLKEANMKMEGLQAEVSALKVLVITSTPSNPGKKSHRRAPSAGQICTDCQTYHCDADGAVNGDGWAVIETQEEKEVDRLAYRDFVSWLEKHCPATDHQFLDQLEKQEVFPCLQFPNQELATEVFNAIKTNSIIVEAVTSGQKPRRCSLTKASVLCPFRIKIGENGKWNFISSGCRARIVAVADLYTFLRYIQQGLIRKEVNAMYWDLAQKRGQISLARLGLMKT